jgi:hypothetical protein
MKRTFWSMGSNTSKDAEGQLSRVLQRIERERESKRDAGYRRNLGR